MPGCRPFADEEIPRILAELDRQHWGLRNRALLILGLKTGFRIAELLSAKVGDFLTEDALRDVEKAQNQPNPPAILLPDDSLQPQV